MISLKEFLKIFKNSKDINFSEQELTKFYQSVPRLITLYDFLGKRAWIEILAIVEAQLPFLKKIADPHLDIYQAAEDKNLVDSFIKLIKHVGENGYSKIIEELVKCYKGMFDYNKSDMDYCRKVAQRYDNMVLTKRIKERKEQKKEFESLPKILGKIKK